MHLLFPSGKTPEEVVKRYLQKVRNPPEEVSSAGNDPLLPTFHIHIMFKNHTVELISMIVNINIIIMHNALSFLL